MSNNGRTITRLRPSFTCVPCKRRKVKCDKQKPGCQHCAKMDVVCFYDTTATGMTNSSQQNVSPQQAISSSSNSSSSSSSSSKRRRVFLEGDDFTSGTSNRPPQNSDMDMPSGIPPPMVFGGSDVTMVTDVGNHSRIAPESYANPDSMLDGLPWDDLHELHGLQGFPATDSGFDFHSTNLLPTPPLSIDHVTGTGWEECPPEFGWFYNQGSHISDLQSGTCPTPPPPAVTQLSEAEKDMTAQNPPQPQDSGNKSLHRPTGPAFWASLGGSAGGRSRLTDGERFRHVQQKKYLDRKFSGRRLSKLHQMARSIPPKASCDVLLQSFLIGVHPLLPLLDVETFLARYDDFWSQRSQERFLDRGEYDSARIPFLGLLWAILYCGAVATPSPLQDKSSPLRTPVSEAFLARLKSKFNETLSLSCYHEVATLDGLVASVLVFECDPDIDGLVGGPLGLSRLVQVAQTLGLDSESSCNGASQSEAERKTGRRVWKHIVHLQVMSTFTSGGPLPSQGGEIDADEGDRHELSDDMSSSTALILAAGRHEMTRTLRYVVNKFSDAHNETEAEKAEAIERHVAKFHNKIDDMIARLSARGLPEQGQIPSQLFEASSLRNSQLYGDFPRQQTVLNSFARILLSMMKHHISIVAGRMLGVPLNGLMPNCILFLHNYLHASQLPAFYPYRWLMPGKWQPLHECFVVLEHLQQSGQGYDVQLLHYLLNEIFDLFEARGDSDESCTMEPWQRAASDLYAGPWSILREVYDNMEGRKCQDGESLSSEVPLQPPASSHSLHRQRRRDFVMSSQSSGNFYPMPQPEHEVKAVGPSANDATWTKLSGVDTALDRPPPQSSVALKDPRGPSRGAQEHYNRSPLARHSQTVRGGSNGGASPSEIQSSRPKSPRRHISHHSYGSDDGAGGGTGDSSGDDSQDDTDELENMWNDFIAFDRSQLS
ncbi:hypothetical protein F5Y17DRAFT_184119 [Xylariaceae sp. FL0594]|nr:hypothetical protein F5Y17DRAFT_184119 [Xylariaceae sp. FL0594]